MMFDLRTATGNGRSEVIHTQKKIQKKKMFEKWKNQFLNVNLGRQKRKFIDQLDKEKRSEGR